MKIALSINPNKSAAIAAAARLVERVGDRAEVQLAAETATALGRERDGRPIEELSGDVLVGIGGDGTFLTLLKQTRVPLLAVNAGTVGFLAEVDVGTPAALDGAIDRLLARRYFLEDRMRLAARLGDQPLPDATNEIVVHTSQVAKMRQFEIAIDGQPVGRIRADGVILATPTGSTSYSLSAMGPVMDPGIEAIVVTALAPFQATQRAVVVDPWRTVSVRLALPDKDGVVVIDGQSEQRVPPGETVEAYRSSRPATFVRFGAQFYRRLQRQRILPWGDSPGADDGGDDADLSTDA